MKSNELNATFHAGVEGRYKIEAFKSDPLTGVEIPGTRRLAADWFDNLITNNGLDLLGAQASTIAPLVACRVGTGNTTPAFTDIALASPLAGTTTIQANVSGVQGAAPYFGWCRRTWRFGTGAAAGNVAEVSVWNALTGGTMFSRALILNAGSPTTITVLSDEQLDVIYEFRIYAATADVAWGPVTISGVSYSGNTRHSNVTVGAYGGNWEPGFAGTPQAGVIINTGAGNNYCYAYATQTLGAVTGQPTGSVYAMSSVTASAYVNGNYYRDHALFWDLNNGNTGTGIGSFRILTNFGAFQASVTPVFAKDATKKLTLNVRVSWSRR